MTTLRYYKPAVTILAAGLAVANLDDEGLRIAFAVTRSTAAEPNTCRVVVSGLSPQIRATLREVHRQLGALPLEVLAGWDRVPKRIFTGLGARVSIDVATTSAGTLEVEAGDGAEGYSAAVLDFATFGITPLELVSLYAAPAMVEPVPGLPLQSLPSATVRLSPTAIATLSSAQAVTVGSYANGYAFSGSARELLDEVCRTIGAQWWIADGILEVVPVAAVIPGPSLVVSSRIGLLDRVRHVDGDAIEFDHLLDPDAEPGRLVVVQDATGAPVGEPAYRVERVVYTGDTGTGSWRMRVLARGGVVLL